MYHTNRRIACKSFRTYTEIKIDDEICRNLISIKSDQINNHSFFRESINSLFHTNLIMLFHRSKSDNMVFVDLFEKQVNILPQDV